MKSIHEEADTRMQKLVLAALENQKRISAFLDVKDAFYCYIFTTWLTCYALLWHCNGIVIRVLQDGFSKENL